MLLGTCPDDSILGDWNIVEDNAPAVAHLRVSANGRVRLVNWIYQFTPPIYLPTDSSGLESAVWEERIVRVIYKALSLIL